MKKNTPIPDNTKITKNSAYLKNLKLSKSLFLSLLILIALIIFIFLNVDEASRFTELAKQARPAWLILAVLLQLGTYICTGLIWKQVISAANHNIPLPMLARFSIEKLSIDELFPTGGVAGNIVVFHAMRSFGLPSSLAAEALCIDIFSHYIALAIVSLTSFTLLVINENLTPAIFLMIGIFLIILIIIPFAIIRLIKNHKPLPKALRRFHSIRQFKKMITHVSEKRVFSVKLLIKASIFALIIILMDVGTIWASFKSIGISISAEIALVSMVIATIAGMISLLPEGIGAFEAGAVAGLSLFDIPIEAALTATLIMRVFTLWLPLLPGLLLTRHDVLAKI